MKTKLEIVEETAAAYSNPSNRALREETVDAPVYAYKTEDGRMCAVGRCMLEPEKFIGSVMNFHLKEGKWSINFDDSFLKEEYRGHNLVFWRDLQAFHDAPEYFDSDKISPQGESYLNKLREFYA